MQITGIAITEHLLEHGDDNVPWREDWHGLSLTYTTDEALFVFDRVIFGTSMSVHTCTVHCVAVEGIHGMADAICHVSVANMRKLRVA